MAGIRKRKGIRLDVADEPVMTYGKPIERWEKDAALRYLQRVGAADLALMLNVQDSQ